MSSDNFLKAEKDDFHFFVQNLQNEITKKMQALDLKLNLVEDLWTRLDHKGFPGGGGKTRAFEGTVFENAGVNTSMVFGNIDPHFAKTLGADSDQMWASGISLIIHPFNPKVPTVHANFRMIQAGSKLWFGGGADLTPFYPYPEDFRYFHQTWKKVLDKYGAYEKMKETCDKYFVNAHRGGEMRGIGGFFFDHYNTGNFGNDVNFVKDAASYFIDSYFPLVEKRMNESFTEEDVEFQLHRHGRYVEFNLLHDRGTMFGLRTNGRTDSILISLPKRCKFTYQYQPQAGSAHAEMMKYYYPQNWV